MRRGEQRGGHKGRQDQGLLGLTGQDKMFVLYSHCNRSHGQFKAESDTIKPTRLLAAITTIVRVKQYLSDSQPNPTCCLLIITLGILGYCSRVQVKIITNPPKDIPVGLREMLNYNLRS